MIKIKFSAEDQQALFEEKTKNTYPIVRKRVEALYLKSLGLSHSQILKILRISEPTLASYLKDYLSGGIEKLKEVNYYRPQSELAPYAETIKKHFEAHPPQNTSEAVAKIEQLCGIKKSPTQVRTFMKSLGMKIRKVGFIPGKQTDPEKQQEQADFKKKL